MLVEVGEFVWVLLKIPDQEVPTSFQHSIRVVNCIHEGLEIHDELFPPRKATFTKAFSPIPQEA